MTRKDTLYQQQLARRNKMICRRFELGHDLKDIAKEAGVQYHVVRSVVRKAGLKRERTSSKAARNAAIIEQYQAGAPVPEIAATFNTTVGVVRQVATVMGARRPKNSEGTTIYVGVDHDKLAARNQDMADIYLSGQPLEVPAKKYGVSRERVRQILTRMGITQRHGGVNSERRVASRKHRALRKDIMDASRAKRHALDMEVRALYDAKVSFKEMSEIMNMGHGTMLQRLRRTGGMNRNRSANRPRRRFSPQETQEILAAYAANEPVEDIAERYDLAPGSVRQMANVHKVHRTAERRGRLTDEQKVEIGKRYASYEPAEDIAKDYGIAINYVGTVAKKVGYSRGKGQGVMEEFLAKMKERKLGQGD